MPASDAASLINQLKSKTEVVEDEDISRSSEAQTVDEIDPVQDEASLITEEMPEKAAATFDLSNELDVLAQNANKRSRKTRILGFNAEEEISDPFAESGSATMETKIKFPVGWVVVTDGPGEGESFALTGGAVQIGRGEDQGICLDFGDPSISRENHAAIAYNHEDNNFVLAQGGKSNLVRLNGKPVLSNETLNNGDDLKVGQTTLRFVALCGDGFRWSNEKQGEAS